jgi:hypothetical protein
MGRACSKYRIWERWENLRERDHLKDVGLDVRTILQSIFKKQDMIMDWIDLAQKSEKWRVLVNAVINPRFSYDVGNLLTS